MTGMFNGYDFSQSRLAFDARYAIPAGEWVVVMPAVGYGRIGADLERMTPTMPSMCGATSTEPCFADVVATYLSMDLHIRVGFTPTFAMSLAGGYLLGLAVGKGMDQITAEVPGGSMKGFHVELGAQGADHRLAGRAGRRSDSPLQHRAGRSHGRGVHVPRGDGHVLRPDRRHRA